MRESRPPGSVRGVRRNVHPYRDRRAGEVSGASERSEATFGYPFIGVPAVVASEIDVLPAKRGDVLEKARIELSCFRHLLCCAFQVHGIPKRDGSHNQVQPTCAMPLILKGSITDFSELIEEHRSCQRVPGLTFV